MHAVHQNNKMCSTARKLVGGRVEALRALWGEVFGDMHMSAAHKGGGCPLVAPGAAYFAMMANA
jgi:hypothetical protein